MQGALRTIDLARAVGLSAQQVRNYEAWGFLPEAPRSAKGYRLYTERHRQALTTARILVAGYGWQTALRAMQALHAGEPEIAFAIADARHAELDRDRADLERVLGAVRAVADQPETWGHGRIARPMRIGVAAGSVGVRASAVRFWEQEGLLRPERDRTSGYRLYDDEQWRRLQVVALLRRAEYGFDEIRTVLAELGGARPQAALEAIERRREGIAAASRACARATAALWRYATESV